MRYTVVDRRGAVSFVGPCAASTALLAACSRNPANLEEFLEYAEAYYRSLKDYVFNGLAVFDEHNGWGNYQAIHEALTFSEPWNQPTFRVVDALTRETSLRPVKAGAILFNLAARRIVQLVNSYSELQRKGRGWVFDGNRNTSTAFAYDLPREWCIVP